MLREKRCGSEAGRLLCDRSDHDTNTRMGTDQEGEKDPMVWTAEAVSEDKRRREWINWVFFWYRQGEKKGL